MTNDRSSEDTFEVPTCSTCERSFSNRAHLLSHFQRPRCKQRRVRWIDQCDENLQQSNTTIATNSNAVILHSGSNEGWDWGDACVGMNWGNDDLGVAWRGDHHDDQGVKELLTFANSWKELTTNTNTQYQTTYHPRADITMMKQFVRMLNSVSSNTSTVSKRHTTKCQIRLGKCGRVVDVRENEDSTSSIPFRALPITRSTSGS